MAAKEQVAKEIRDGKAPFIAKILHSAENAQNLPLTLAKLPAGGVVNATLLCVNDFQISLEMNIEIRHKPNSDFDEKENPERVDILTGVAEAAAPAPAAVADVVQNDENAGPPAAKKARTDA